MKNVTVPLDFRGRKLAFTFPNEGNVQQHIQNILSGKDYPIPPLPEDYKFGTIVDIGANVGAAAIWFLTVAPETRIVCFEPAKDNFDCLRENLKPFAKAESHHCGLFSEEKAADLHLGANQCMQHSIVANVETGAATETIVLKRASTEFDRLDIKSVSILKIDTEGCEVDILRDLSTRLSNVDIIFLEWHSDEDRRSLDEMLSKDFLLTNTVASFPHRGNVCYLAKRVAARVSGIDALRISRNQAGPRMAASGRKRSFP